MAALNQISVVKTKKNDIQKACMFICDTSVSVDVLLTKERLCDLLETYGSFCRSNYVSLV